MAVNFSARSVDHSVSSGLFGVSSSAPFLYISLEVNRSDVQRVRHYVPKKWSNNVKKTFIKVIFHKICEKSYLC